MSRTTLSGRGRSSWVVTGTKGGRLRSFRGCERSSIGRDGEEAAGVPPPDAANVEGLASRAAAAARRSARTRRARLAAAVRRLAAAAAARRLAAARARALRAPGAGALVAGGAAFLACPGGALRRCPSWPGRAPRPSSPGRAPRPSSPARAPRPSWPGRAPRPSSAWPGGGPLSSGRFAATGHAKARHSNSAPTRAETRCNRERGGATVTNFRIGQRMPRSYVGSALLSSLP